MSATVLAGIYLWPVWAYDQAANAVARREALRADAIAAKSYLEPCDSFGHGETEPILEILQRQVDGELKFSVAIQPSFRPTTAVGAIVSPDGPKIAFVEDEPDGPPPRIQIFPISHDLLDALSEEWRRSTRETWNRPDQHREFTTDGTVAVFRIDAHCGVEVASGGRTAQLWRVVEALYAQQDEATIRRALRDVPPLPTLEE